MASRHRGALVVALVVVGIAVAVFVTVRTGTGAHTSRPSGTASPTTRRPPLGGAAAELVRLLEGGGGLNFDVAYAVADPGRGPSTAHLWQRPPLARLDSESGTGDATHRSSALVTSSGPVSCERQGSGPWSCAPKPGLRLGDLGVVPLALKAQLGGLDVSARDDQIGGQVVRCFTLSPAPGATPAPGAEGAGSAAELCVTPDGIPARVVAGSTRLDLVSLQRGRLPDSVFDPPAPVG